MNPIDRLLSLIAPDDCLGCQAEGSLLCRDCIERIEPLLASCYGCGKLSPNFKTCPKCSTKWRPGHAWLYTAYKDSPADLVRLLKFEQKRAAAQIMAELLDDTLPYFAEKPLVSYVPTAPSRRRERGFDHAQLLAKELAKRRGWQVATLLSRKAKVRQLGSTRDIRKAQLKDAFRPANSRLINDNYILLIDDVVTTGATIEACAKTLLKAGASVVDVAAFAYTAKNKY